MNGRTGGLVEAHVFCVPTALAQGSAAGELKSNASTNSKGQMATFIYLYSPRC